MRSFSFSPRSLGLAFVMLAAVSSTSCFDPEHKDEVNALGGETNGVGPGPLHRPGQPCLACHGGSGPGSPEFSIAGTIYLNRGDETPQEGVQVTITDAYGAMKTLPTNGAGNFYISKDQWSPTFPAKVNVAFQGLTAMQAKAQPQMQTVIGRNGGCGFCHYGVASDQTHMAHIYLINSGDAGQ